MRKIIYVLSHGNNWKVQCEHCEAAIKYTKYSAIALAKDHVAKLPQGSISQIIVQGNDGKFMTEWTYGKDPFPPRG